MEDELDYKVTTDADGKMLSGENFYRLTLPLGMPSCVFWSVIVYDSGTGFIITTDQSWPSVHSNCTKLVVDSDGSVDIWFAPTDCHSKKKNWIKTIPGEKWFMILRLYGIAGPMTDHPWQPGEIKPVLKEDFEAL
jgi:hypothetical protein